MKKVFTFVAAVAFVASLSSCKKDYSCDCTTKDSGDSSYSMTYSTSMKAKKKDAEEACDALVVTVGTLSTTCELNKK